MAEGISIKATTITGTRSRGRVATRTCTLLRGVREDAHPAQVMRAMSVMFTLLERVPAYYVDRGVRYDLLRVETRVVDGVRVHRAVFKDERTVRKAFARQMRCASRIRRRAAHRAARAEVARRRALGCALLASAYAAKISRNLALFALACLAVRAPLRVLSLRSLSASTAEPLASAPYG